MKLLKVSEQLKSVWKSLKTTPAVVALFTIFSQQHANAKWISLPSKKVICSETKVESIYTHVLASWFHDENYWKLSLSTTTICEWWFASTVIGSFTWNHLGWNHFGRNTLYNKAGKPQKCRCVPIVTKWVFSTTNIAYKLELQVPDEDKNRTK